ncbi:MAG: hypothetical protein OQK25_06515 [Gammaproteobacteria bacterium]|nr:hypothetical protein [Gammaproteobacteria bacterium]
MPGIRRNRSYRPISLLEMTMRQTLDGMEDFTSSYGLEQSLLDIEFELLDTHAVEPLPTKKISHPFSARILRFPNLLK